MGVSDSVVTKIRLETSSDNPEFGERPVGSLVGFELMLARTHDSTDEPGLFPPSDVQ